MIPPTLFDPLEPRPLPGSAECVTGPWDILPATAQHFGEEHGRPTIVARRVAR